MMMYLNNSIFKIKTFLKKELILFSLKRRIKKSTFINDINRVICSNLSKNDFILDITDLEPRFLLLTKGPMGFFDMENDEIINSLEINYYTQLLLDHGYLLELTDTQVITLYRNIIKRSRLIKENKNTLNLISQSLMSL